MAFSYELKYVTIQLIGMYHKEKNYVYTKSYIEIFTGTVLISTKIWGKKNIPFSISEQATCGVCIQ